MNMYSKNVSNKSVDIKLNTCTYFFKGLFWCMHSMSGLDVSSNTEINKLERCQQETNGNLFFANPENVHVLTPSLMRINFIYTNLILHFLFGTWKIKILKRLRRRTTVTN